MENYIYAIILGSYYTVYVVLHKLLARHFNFDKIMVNVYILIAFFSLIIFGANNIISPTEIINNLDSKYFYILFMAVAMFLGGCTWIKAAKDGNNLGIIEGAAMAWYLPVLVTIMAFFFKQKISIRNIIGIIALSIGGYLTLT